MEETELMGEMEKAELVTRLQEVKSAPNAYALKVHVLKNLPDGELKTRVQETVSMMDFLSLKDQIVEQLGV